MDMSQVAIDVVAELGGIALREEVLNVDIRHSDILVARFECIQAAVGVLLQEIETRQVVLNAVVPQVPEEAKARLLFRKNKAAEVAGELLRAGADGEEVI